MQTLIRNGGIINFERIIGQFLIKIDLYQNWISIILYIWDVGCDVWFGLRGGM